MKSFLAAIQFLTICPLPSRIQCTEAALKRSVIFYPAIGIIIGTLMAFLDWGFTWLFPPLPASALVVIAMLAVSGCLHMDGLADSADGFLSSRPKERILEIMRDSRTGPMGVVAVAGLLLLKTTALASVSGATRWGVVLLMPLAGRCALVIEMALLPYARPGGLVTVFGRPRWAFTAPLILAATAWFALGPIGLTAAGASMLAVLAFSFWCKSKIGGYTGDTLGAACEIAELMPALVAASWRWPQ